MSLSLNIYCQQLPLKSVFRIARGAKTTAEVIVVTLSDGKNIGWAEAVPYARYKESITSVKNQIQDICQPSSMTDIATLEQAIAKMLSGAAKNVLDCSLWDLKAKQQQQPVAELMLLPESKQCISAQTLSIDTPEAMAKAVKSLKNPPLVKVKLDQHDIIKKMTAIAAAAPQSKFIVDANEGWTFDNLTQCAEQLKQLNVVLIEQPLAVGQDQQLNNYTSPIPLCADESCHTVKDLENLKGKYQVVNIKLDKTGGLTQAFALAKEAQAQGFSIMLGCMVGSSLAMAPATLLTSMASFVDLDGPFLIAEDKENGFIFHQGVMSPLSYNLWGGAQNYQTNTLSQLK